MTTQRLISVVSDDATHLETAVTVAGGELVALGERTSGLVWAGSDGPPGLAAALKHAPNVDWVQLPAAGIESFVNAGVMRPGILWTAAQGAYARPVAEHTLALVLSCLRVLPERARASSWAPQKGRPLYGCTVLIVGGGGIAAEITRLLQPFGVTVVCVRHRADEALPGAHRTVGDDALLDELSNADIVIVALALNASTAGMFSAAAFAAMKDDAVFVNIARGGHVDTAALLEALHAGRFFGVALDVTDPEPLPDGHPLWDIDRVLITPHTANTAAMLAPLFADRVSENVARYLAGAKLVGVAELSRGY